MPSFLDLFLKRNEGNTKDSVTYKAALKGVTMRRNDSLSFLPKQKKNEKAFSDNKKSDSSLVKNVYPTGGVTINRYGGYHGTVYTIGSIKSLRVSASLYSLFL